MYDSECRQNDYKKEAGMTDTVRLEESIQSWRNQNVMLPAKDYVIGDNGTHFFYDDVDKTTTTGKRRRERQVVES